MVSRLRAALVLAVALTCGCYTVPKTPRYVASVEPPPAWTTTEDRARIGARYMDVATDRPRYELIDDEIHVTIILRVRDTTPGSVVLRGCPRAPSRHVQEWDGTSWRVRGSFGDICAAYLSTETLVLTAGDTLTTEVSIAAPGRYRVEIPSGFYSPPEFVGLSNEFVVGRPL